MEKKYFVSLFLVGAFCFVFGRVQSQDKEYSKHQVGISATNFVKGILPSQKYSYLLNYNYSISEQYSLRSGFNFYNLAAKDGYFEYSLKFGADKVFRDYKSWKFKFGIDIISSYVEYKSDKRKYYFIGLAPFLSIQFFINKHFSLSTEPNIYGVFYQSIDPNGFASDSNKNWAEYGLGNFGQLQINFHF
jgi:hypothetical protein